MAGRTKLMDPDHTSLSIEQTFGILRRRAPWVLLCLIVISGVAYGWSKRETKKYTATAALSFSSSVLSQEIAGLSTNSSSALAQEDSNLELVKLGDMAAKTARL